MKAYVVLLASAALSLTIGAGPASAKSGAEILKALNHDGDQTLEIPEVIDLATKLFSAINPDGDTTLEPDETEGRLSKADWKAVNRDGDETLEMDEWLSIARKRFRAADKNKDRKLDEKELDSKAGQKLILMIAK